MKVVLLSVGKTDEDFYVRAIEMFKKRLSHYIPFELDFVPDVKNRKNLSEKEQKQLEGEAILNRIQPGDHVVLLDDKGKQYSSMEFSAFIEKRSHSVPKRLVFVVGGPYGFADQVYDRANEKLSLSRMTFTHQMVRLVFVEQLYRAMTILNGEPYHHE
ncbi:MULTISPECIES: 23S rRNA (pseudouridine(1915)-N(3))-methyltransferase RlmH [Petrimonas]|jgi:23S rRNA (pseudouridine1915-N3)-methyltransferase|uniref:Ribosomal RNA large subunit methyltransferase H n=1 Tax=Petrimonas mucosa TaxID=1642646 RepID=A0A1G4G4C1_9BACT|nr:MULTISPECIES: 23S rRNA (pseudouridine(1915)-N(3))-methyltransferase RlmH [Petrimonas]MDD3561666.1 23S rRNA (pseudouridine(1915)-N(3))-methyltransferase RlmH [Petrimonas mucosa]SCM55748.1 Ribosomal RNA large subunit methyltransferase H {ECO:0000255/HAMAP-Rule:MF_00658} [Petrimonas mucosa]SFU65215.1 23S rRNA (pseudouridine1915-N3)-methyltransferase [Porphyromonadaceae bacterium KHP3R9]HHT28969.1 23S rRNA (pseudouridine(1915)-N(3))-methyltransferase RlmH [Petrimonas mucosa]